MAPVLLFWTGGWDSTFRLMMLLVAHKQAVQPYYYIDDNRKSFPTEVRTMAQITQRIAADWPEARKRLLPTVFVAGHDVRPDPIVTHSHELLCIRHHIGAQYDFLTRLAKQWNITGIEIGITHSDDPQDIGNVFLKDNIQAVEDPRRGRVYIIRKTAGPVKDVFEHFVFPLLDLGKKDMANIAATHGFAHILEMTWFCYNPRRNNRTCGFCRPCQATRSEGLGRRVSSPPLTYRIQRFAVSILPTSERRQIRKWLDRLRKKRSVA